MQGTLDCIHQNPQADNEHKSILLFSTVVSDSDPLGGLLQHAFIMKEDSEVSCPSETIAQHIQFS